MKTNELQTSSPTIGFNFETVVMNNMGNWRKRKGALTCAELVELLDLSKIQQNWSI
jgi:hypothetical protein